MATLPDPIRASESDLPAAVRAAFVEPLPPRTSRIEADGIPWSVLQWGPLDGPALLLLHGITASARVWWRVGPALAADGRRVIAPDLPGHGRTGAWTGHHRFRDNARDVAHLAVAIGATGGRLNVVGHSWGAMTAAALPAVGLVPERIVLVDPPTTPAEEIAAMVHDPTNRAYDILEEARRAVRQSSPTWSDEDVEAKAEALVQLDVVAARAVLLDNSTWDGGLADLADPAARDVEVWLVRGEEAAGGLVPDAAIPALADRIGAHHVLTIAGASHSPQRTHPAATVVALLRALGDAEPDGP